ncbi:MAG: SoxR reducing system RseC family protein [Bacteroidales bacterium]
MGSPGIIEHLGVISEIGDNLVKVHVTPESACGNCRAKGSCSLGSEDEKTIEINTSQGESYFVGEKIKVVLEQSLGMKALGLGYFLPFIIVLTILIILTSLDVSEGLAGLLSLATLMPYYVSLTLFKKVLKRQFSFKLKKCN